MLCTTALNTSNTIRTQTGAGRTPLQRSGFWSVKCRYKVPVLRSGTAEMWPLATSTEQLVIVVLVSCNFCQSNISYSVCWHKSNPAASDLMMNGWQGHAVNCIVVAMRSGACRESVCGWHVSARRRVCWALWSADHQLSVSSTLHWRQVPVQSVLLSLLLLCLQFFDTVDWAAGRASGL